MSQIGQYDRFLTIPRFAEIPFLVHGFGTKHMKERDLNLETEKFTPVFLEQVHSDVVHLIDRLPSQRLKGDALLSRHPGFLLVVETADCLPVLIADETRKAVAAVHCGWKGTSRGLVEKVVKKMISACGCSAASLLVGLGPCIEGDCYQVGDDVRNKFINGHLNTRLFRPHPNSQGKYFFDLREANRRMLIHSGVKVRNIFSLDECTYCHDDLISFRQDQQKARMLNFIGIRG